MYRPTQYVDYQSMPGCRVSRKSSRKRKNKHGLRCWQYGNVPCPRAYCGCGSTLAKSKGNIRQPLSRSRSLKTTRNEKFEQSVRYKELATVKKPGCGPNCKYYRCAANDPCYAWPFHAPRELQVKETAKKIKQSPKTKIKRSIGVYVSESYLKDDDDTMVEDIEQKNLNEFSEQHCDQNFIDCSETSCDSTTSEKTTKKKSNSCNTSLRSLTMKTVACNTQCYHSCYNHPEVHEVQTKVLKDVNSNAMLELLHKQTSTLPKEKVLVSTPLPRVAMLRPPRPASLQILTQKDRQMIRYALQKKHFPTPRPITHEAFLYDHGAQTRLESGHETPSQPTLEVALYSQFSQTSTPISLTSRRETPQQEMPRRGSTTRTKMHPQYQKWLPGKLSPRLITPPLVKSTYSSQTPRELLLQPQSSPTPLESTPIPSKSTPTPTKSTPTPPKSTPTPPKSMPTPPKLIPLLHQKTTPPMPMSMPTITISTFTSDYDSDATTTSNATTNSKSSSQTTPSVCCCRLCGKSQAIYKNNNNNPLYDLVSPMQSPSRMGGHAVATMGSHSRVLSRAWTWFLMLCEVVVILVLAGLFTMKLMPFVESIFRAYMAGSCSGKGVGHGPHLTTDGLKSGIESWITCPITSRKLP